MPGTEISTQIQGRLITTAESLILDKEAEIVEGERVLAEMLKIKNISKHKLGRVRGRINFCKKVVQLLKEGFIPIPRMEFEPVNVGSWKKVNGHYHRYSTIVIDRLPVHAITQVAEYQDKFDRFGIVRGNQGLTRKRRDPFLIGIVEYGQQQEQYILAWWRPDIMKPAELW